MAGAVAPAASGPLCIVLNAASGRHDAQATQDLIKRRLDAAGRVHHLELIDRARPVAQAAQAAVQQARRTGGVVVAVGGDGTINAVAQATLGSGCAFGVLPQGTFNYFGRTHGIPEDAQDALDALLAGRPEPVQVGMANERIFLVNASLGLYPQLLEDREAFKAQYGRSRLVALWSGIVTLLREHRQLQLRIAWRAEDEALPGTARVGGELRLRTPTLFVGNNRLQFEQVGIAEAPALDQGRLVAIALRPVGTWTMFGLLLRGAFGRLGEADQVLTLPVSSLTVRPSARIGRARLKLATDGEIVWMRTPIEFRVAPQPLWLIKPPPAAADAASLP
ncbi:MAG: diacylglycerol kinase [Ideonella sp.]|nr:diacylglycerol kinase [Ideonella sp.]